MKKDTVIIIGAGNIGKSTADYLIEAAKERGVKITSEPEPMIFKAAPKFEIPAIMRQPDNTGQENRRARRKNKNKTK